MISRGDLGGDIPIPGTRCQILSGPGSVASSQARVRDSAGRCASFPHRLHRTCVRTDETRSRLEIRKREIALWDARDYTRRGCWIKIVSLPPPRRPPARPGREQLCFSRQRVRCALGATCTRGTTPVLHRVFLLFTDRLGRDFSLAKMFQSLLKCTQILVPKGPFVGNWIFIGEKQREAESGSFVYI